MARIRTIKPEFPASEQVIECSRDARLLFLVMLCFCDDQGVHQDSMKQLRAEVFPADDDMTVDKVGGLVGELVEHGLLVRFKADGKRYLFVTGWSKHQKVDRPNNRHPSPPIKSDEEPPKKSAKKPAVKAPKKGNSSNDRRMLDERSTPEGSRVEKKVFNPESSDSLPRESRQPSMLLPINGAAATEGVVKKTLEALGRASRASTRPDFSDPAVRKARWESRVIEHLNATTPAAKVAAIVEDYMNGTAAGLAAFERASKAMGQRRGGNGRDVQAGAA